MAKLLSGTRIYGTANVDSSLAVGGVIYAPGNITSTSNTTGTIVVTGGIGVTGNIYSTGIITGTFSGSGASLTGTAAGLTANVANYESVTTATTGTYYPQLALGVSGTYASYANTALSFAPSTGTLSSTVFSGSGASLTNLPAGNLSGTIPSAVLGNSTLYVGTTAVTLNRASTNLALTGISSITLPGSSSGTAQIIPSAAAGTGTVITLPATTGTVITSGDTGTVTNTMLAGSIANAKLANSTISGIALGSNLNQVTFNNGGAGGASGSTYNGSGALTVSHNTIGASPLAGSSSITTTGTVTSGTWSGSFGAVSGANLTNLTAGNLSGTIPSNVLGNSTVYIGSTAVALNRASSALTLTDINIINGSSSSSGTLTLRSTSDATKATAGILMDEGIASTSTTTGTLVVTGGVGISGALNASTKSFIIPHPTKKKHLLKHGSLEGPEFGVYVRGKVKGNVIELPEYWTKLVDPDSITVQLTPIGKHQKLYVDKIENNKVYIGNEGLFAGKVEAFYMINAERIDVNKLDVEAKE